MRATGEWLACNARLLGVKALSILIVVSPFKGILVNALTLVYMVSFAIRRRGLRGRISAFAAFIDAPARRPFFITRYFWHQSRIKVFTSLYYESPRALKKFIAVDGLDEVEAAVAQGRGALLLGGHLGPVLTTHILRDAGIDAVPMADHSTEASLDKIFRLGLPFLMRKKFLFTRYDVARFAPGRSEKRFVSHLKSGGVALMAMDFPRKSPGGVGAAFFGRTMNYNYFAFKLALKYGVPVFFYSFEPRSRAGFRLRISRVDPFASIEEGVQVYALYFEDRIRTYPFFWTSLPCFAGWFPEVAVPTPLLKP